MSSIVPPLEGIDFKSVKDGGSEVLLVIHAKIFLIDSAAAVNIL